MKKILLASLVGMSFTSAMLASSADSSTSRESYIEGMLREIANHKRSPDGGYEESRKLKNIKINIQLDRAKNLGDTELFDGFIELEVLNHNNNVTKNLKITIDKVPWNNIIDNLSQEKTRKGIIAYLFSGLSARRQSETTAFQKLVENIQRR